MTAVAIDPADLIAAHTAGSAEALAASIERGEQEQAVFPVDLREQPTEREATSDEEAVGSLLAGFLAVKRGHR